MQKIDMLVKAPHIYTMQGEGVGYIGDAAMAVDRGRIVAVGPQSEVCSEFCAEQTIDAYGRALLPGLIDAHIHTSHAVLRGLAQDTRNWMMHGIGPFVDIERASPEIMNAGSELALLEAVRSGTTTFGDWGTNMHDVCALLQKMGARGHISSMIRDAVVRIYDQGELYEYDESLGRKLLEINLDLYERWNNAAGGRISVHFGPQGADFVSEPMLVEIGRLALQKKMKIHMHVAQGDRETAQMTMRYSQRPIEWLDSIGYLNERLIAVHLTDATVDEAQMLARKACSMVVCSGSIAVIDGVVPPSRPFRDAGGYVALGSDQAPGNNCHNIINEMKLTALFNKIQYQDPEAMPAWQVLRMATIEGAHALGLADQIGSLEPGKCADFITINLSAPTMAPVYTQPMRNIVPNLVYSAMGDEVDTVVVDGQVIYQAGAFSSLDSTAVIERAERCARHLGEAAAERFWKINGINAQFMREHKL